MRADAIASQLLQNGRFTNPDREFSRQAGKEVAELWKVDNNDVNMSTPFTTEELVEVLRSMQAGKAPGPDDIHPEFLLGGIPFSAVSFEVSFLSVIILLPISVIYHLKYRMPTILG